MQRPCDPLRTATVLAARKKPKEAAGGRPERLVPDDPASSMGQDPFERHLRVQYLCALL